MKVRHKVLIVDDEPHIRRLIHAALARADYAIVEAENAREATERLRDERPDITLLDLGLPDRDGLELVPLFKQQSDTTLIVVSARDATEEKVAALDLGADDYLTKPFELRELVLRLRALDRRRAQSRPPVWEIAGLRLDPFRREVYRDGRYVGLTRKQFAVLEVLVAAEGGVVSAEELLERAWDENADPFTNAVRITVSALRKRLGEPWIIATVPGVGYRIENAASSGPGERNDG